MSDGISYCVNSQCLHIHLSRPVSSLKEVTKSLQHQTSKYQYISSAKSLKLSVAHSYIIDDDKDAIHQFSRALSSALPQLETLQVQPINPGMFFTQGPIQAILPVQLIVSLIQELPALTSLQLRNLQLKESMVAGNVTLANALEGHASLQQFEWEQSNFLSHDSSLLPVLEALTTIRRLQSVTVKMPQQDGITRAPASLLDKLTTNSPDLTHLTMTGVAIDLTATQQRTTSHCIKTVELGLLLPPCPLQATAAAKTVSQWLSSSTESLTLHLYSEKRPELVAVQLFQATLGNNLCEQPQQKLQHLHIVCRGLPISPPSLCVQSFRRALECNPNLTQLSLPCCGELDSQISFLLQVDKSGIRSVFTQGEDQSRLLQARELLETTTNTEATRFSLLYYFLRQNPCLIVR